MTFVTLKVLEGMERGSLYAKLPLPVTIGRESDSDVQLNDDRVSRAHAKLQDHAGQVILTDLGSTNGTRVNGHPIQMRVMQHGDVVLIGRCVLLFNQSLGDEPLTDLDDPRQTMPEAGSDDNVDIDFDDGVSLAGSDPGILFPQGRPPLPHELSALQRVQLSDLLSYVHEQLGDVIKRSLEDLHGSPVRSVKCDWITWNKLTALQAEMAQDIRSINNPE